MRCLRNCKDGVGFLVIRDHRLLFSSTEWSLCLERTYIACSENQGWAAHLQLKGCTDFVEGAWHWSHQEELSRSLPGRDDIRESGSEKAKVGRWPSSAPGGSKCIRLLYVDSEATGCLPGASGLYSAEQVTQWYSVFSRRTF